jgi:uridine phosphorylase
VGSLGTDSADSLVVDAAISGSLKSPSVNHSEPTQRRDSDPIQRRDNDPTQQHHDDPIQQRDSDPTQQSGGEPTQRRDGKPTAQPRQVPTRTGEKRPAGHREPIHLRPTATVAKRVLLPGDPGRALALAQFLLEQPLMFNHHRGLWGYTGAAADGDPLTIQSTGMGGPSAAIVLHELIALGVTRAIRVGTCGALDDGLRLGDLIVAREAIAADGTSAALGASELTRADPTLADALSNQLGLGRPLPGGHAGQPSDDPAYEQATERADDAAGVQAAERADDAAGKRKSRASERTSGDPARGEADEPRRRQGRIVSTDLFYERDSKRNVDWRAAGAIAVEMEASALFAVGATAGIQVACVLAVSDTFDGPSARMHIDDDALLRSAEAMGSAATAALSS